MSNRGETLFNKLDAQLEGHTTTEIMDALTNLMTKVCTCITPTLDEARGLIEKAHKDMLIALERLHMFENRSHARN